MSFVEFLGVNLEVHSHPILIYTRELISVMSDKKYYIRK